MKNILGNGVILEMATIPGGTFMMGSPESELGKYGKYGSLQHQVTIPNFFMGKYPVTQAQYQAIVGTNPSNFKGDNRPVETVSWDDAVAFCQKLNQKIGKNYRLPSEAQWEYACRAGTTTPFYFGETITTDLVNYNANHPCGSAPKYGSAPKGKGRKQTTDVDSFPPNAFGLYDMHGNVNEWCEDDFYWDGINRYGTLRGGNYIENAHCCRSAFRCGLSHKNSKSSLGFRVVVFSKTF
jgi:formylglycine-generating enzyme required for sulfatase activity